MLGLEIIPGSLSFGGESVSAIASVRGKAISVTIPLDGSALTVSDLRVRLWEAYVKIHDSQ